MPLLEYERGENFEKAIRRFLPILTIAAKNLAENSIPDLQMK